MALLAKSNYDNVKVIYDVLINEINKETDGLYIDCKPNSQAELIALELSGYLGIKTNIIPRATEVAEAVIIIYEDNTYEIHNSQTSFEDRIEREVNAQICGNRIKVHAR